MNNFLLVLFPLLLSSFLSLLVCLFFFFMCSIRLKLFWCLGFGRFLFSTVTHRFFFHSLCILKIILFTYFWLHWVFAATQAFSLVAAEGGLLSSCGVWASHYGSFSCCRAPALGHSGFSSWHLGSVVSAPVLWSTGSKAVQHRLSCPEAGGVFPDQGSNPYTLHRQEDSLPSSHQGSLIFSIFISSLIISWSLYF